MKADLINSIKATLTNILNRLPFEWEMRKTWHFCTWILIDEKLKSRSSTVRHGSYDQMNELKCKLCHFQGALWEDYSLCFWPQLLIKTPFMKLKTEMVAFTKNGSRTHLSGYVTVRACVYLRVGSSSYETVHVGGGRGNNRAHGLSY